MKLVLIGLLAALSLGAATITHNTIVYIDPYETKPKLPAMVSKFADRDAGVVCYIYGGALTDKVALSFVKIGRSNAD